MNVAGYVRVSTQEQGDSGAGIAAQMAAIEVACKQRGLTLAATYCDEAVSGSTPLDSRPQGRDMLDALSAGTYDGLIVSKLDRLSRSAFDFASTMRRSLAEEWAIICLDLGVDTTTPSGKMIAQVMSAFAEFELDMIRQRTRDGLAAKRAMGVRLGRPVSAHPLTTEYIMKLHDEGLNYSQIARCLEGAELETPRGGKRWYVTTVRDIILRGAN